MNPKLVHPCSLSKISLGLNPKLGQRGLSQRNLLLEDAEKLVWHVIVPSKLLAINNKSCEHNPSLRSSLNLHLWSPHQRDTHVRGGGQKPVRRMNVWNPFTDAQNLILMSGESFPHARLVSQKKEVFTHVLCVACVCGPHPSSMRVVHANVFRGVTFD